MEIIEYIPKRIFAANTYIVFDDNNVIMIDPGDNTGDLEMFLKAHNLDHIDAILLTHAHFDHIMDIINLNKTFNFNIYLSNLEIPVLLDSELNESVRFGSKVDFSRLKEKIIGFNDKEILTFGKLKFTCILTPFHTLGSTCYLLNNTNHLFTGDTLFKGCVGRTDLKASCPHKMKDSLNKIKKLSPSLIIYPGHDELTTLEEELNKNKFLK